MKKQSQIEQAVHLLREGGLVAFPTETVYGLGADAGNAAAIEKVFLAKKRPLSHPLIVHIAELSQLSFWASDIPEDALKLAKAFWPGPLTLVLPKQSHVLKSVTGGQETVGLRIPAHPLARSLLQAFGSGIVAPSANQFTHISPTTAAAVIEELGDQVDLVLDGGACEVGVESTIVDFSRGTPLILRPGMITREMIAAVIQKRVDIHREEESSVRAPGMHHVHYAPTTPVVLVPTQELVGYLAEQSRQLPIAVMAYSDLALPKRDNLSVIRMPSQAASYAHDLYHQLRQLDHVGVKLIVIEAVPQDAVWDAIRDRLKKAAGR